MRVYTLTLNPAYDVHAFCAQFHEGHENLADTSVKEAGGKGVTVLDSRRTTLSEYYRELAAEFLPGRRLRECCVPMAVIRPVAALSTFLSRTRPLFDPTLYALDTVAHNLDFSNRRMRDWFAALGLREHVATTFR